MYIYNLNKGGIHNNNIGLYIKINMIKTINIIVTISLYISRFDNRFEVDEWLFVWPSPLDINGGKLWLFVWPSPLDINGGKLWLFIWPSPLDINGGKLW